jgi:hypothetical protein
MSVVKGRGAHGEWLLRCEVRRKRSKTELQSGTVKTGASARRQQVGRNAQSNPRDAAQPSLASRSVRTVPYQGRGEGWG